jgi:RimJ/RimL family protein N-acetyltransferase
MRRVTTENQEYMRAWLSRMVQIDFPNNARFIGQEIDGEIQAVVGYCGFLPNSCQMHCASLVDNWISKDLLWASFDYPFNKLGVEVILAPLHSGNKEAIRLNRHLGFEVKAEIEHGHMDGDLTIMAMKKEQCRWLTISAPLNKGE